MPERTPREGQGEIPERGVVEVKGLAEPRVAIADTDQVSRYWQRYRLVLVTNYREFLLVGVDVRGQPVRLEGFTLAETDAAFWDACAHPRRIARQRVPASSSTSAARYPPRTAHPSGRPRLAACFVRPRRARPR